MTSGNLPGSTFFADRQRHPAHPPDVLREGWRLWKRAMPAVAVITLLLDGFPTVLFATLDGWFDQPALAFFGGSSRPAPSPSRLTQPLMPLTLGLTAVSWVAMTRVLLL